MMGSTIASMILLSQLAKILGKIFQGGVDQAN